MCEALRELMKDEIEEQKQKARQETSQEIRQETIKNLMDSMKWTAEQAMDALKLPMDDRAKYVSRL